MEGRAGGPLLREQSVGGGPWEGTASILASTATFVGPALPVSANTSFRLHYIGNEVSADAFSSVVRVLVRRAVSLAGVSSSVTYVSTVGRTRTLVAALGPTSPQVAVTLKIYRYDSSPPLYLLPSTIQRTSVSGKATFAWRP